MVLVDTNVLIDILVEDAQWIEWSRSTLQRCFGEGVGINQLILAEVATQFKSFEQVNDALPADLLIRLNLPWEASFVAGLRFADYRKRGGSRDIPLPDFYIGAHALVSNFTLLTRDSQFYKTNFPEVRLICP
jgi:predicted nucleic acid-binding protein